LTSRCRTKRRLVRAEVLLPVMFLFLGNALGQLQYIDLSKLPSDRRVQDALSNVRSVEQMTRYWSSNWTYDTPKKQVASLLRTSLNDLRQAIGPAPQNEELLLLTGLAAHFAYNMDVEDTYEVAVQSFEKAGKLAPTDYRPDWFLAAHRCQSTQVATGMQLLLTIEARVTWQQLPVDFWDDYINCSTISVMPAHTLRAVDHAVHLGGDAGSYRSAVDIAHRRYKISSADATYGAREAWQAAEVQGEVRFTSNLCGIGFSARGSWRMDIRDVSGGTCISTMETGPYPSRSGTSTPTLLILTRPAKPGETLEEFTLSFLKKYPEARSSSPSSCPSEKCLGFEVVTDSTYSSEGGGHFLVAAFASEPPEFPGLLLERPEALPMAASRGDEVKYYHPNERLQRLPGTLYTVVELDANGDIFTKASADFEYLLRSIQLD